MLNINLNNVEAATERKNLEAGGYVCGICAVEDAADKQYLRINFDIIEGEYKNYFRDLKKRLNLEKWVSGGTTIRSYKEKALPFFKQFINAVEASNSGYKFDNDETKLRGKLVGIVLGEEEYEKMDGTIGKRLKAVSFHPVADIRNGSFRVPPLKVLSGGKYDEFRQIESTDDLPF